MKHHKLTDIKDTLHQNFETTENVIYCIKKAYSYNKLIIIDLFFNTLLVPLTPLIPILIPKIIIDELSGNQRMLKLLVIVISLFVILALSNYIIEIIKSSSNSKIIGTRLNIMNEYYKKCLNDSIAQNENPEYLNKKETIRRTLMSDAGVEAVLHNIFKISSQIVELLFYIYIINRISIWITILILMSIGVTYMLTSKVKKFEYILADDISDKKRKADYSYNTLSDFSFGKEIRIYKISNYLFDLFKENRYLELSILKKIKSKYLKVGITESILTLAKEGVVYIYLINLVLTGKITIGDFTLFIGAINGLSNSINNITHSYIQMISQNRYVRDIREFINLEEDDVTKEYSNSYDIEKNFTNKKFDIEFINVSFKYPGSNNYALRNISLKVNSDEHIAIVGRNGSGKSTFIKLLCGLYSTTEGTILINGIDIKEYRKRDLYNLFSVVFQDINVIALTINEFITAGNSENQNKKYLYSVLKKVEMLDLVESLPLGIDTSLLKIIDDKGIDLSGGQKQNLMISRAIYKDSPIMILDEPTSALDPIKELMLYEKFSDFAKDKTAIFISHRLASTKFCHRILVFDSGKIIEEGTHEELMSTKGMYNEMYSIQSKYYNSGRV